MRAVTHRRTTFVIGLVCCLALAGAAAARQARLSLSGRVVLEAPGQRPPALPRFTARLYAPKELRRPTVVTYTDAAGGFKFEGLAAGPYLLKISRDGEMVYQKELMLDEKLEQPLVITLRARA